MASLSVEPFVEPGSCLAGDIRIRNPWPGIVQTIWGQSERLVDSYYKKYCRDPESRDWRDWPYLVGDGASGRVACARSSWDDVFGD
jgi:acyl-coenzyme A synthetase/AMP-(fatty) acid ligase